MLVLKSDQTANEILQALGGVFLLGPRDGSTEVRTYRDTFDWRLFRSGFILSNVSAGTQTRLTLKDAEGIPSEVLISKVPLFALDLPHCSLRTTLEPVIKNRRLFPQAKADWVTTLVPVLKPDRSTAARIRLREGRGHLPEGMGETNLGTRLEILPLPGGRAQVRELTAYLKKALQLKKERRPEAHSVYDAVGKAPGDYSSSFRLKLKPRQAAGRAARRVHSSLLQVLLANQEGVARDWDPEFLHDFRVSIRRTRSALSLLDGVFPEESVAYFSKEFRWLSLRTGRVRDLDVHLQRMPAFRAALDPSSGVDLEPLVQLLKEKKRKEHRRLRDCLRSKRYRRLITEWSAFLEDPARTGSAGPLSKAPIQEVAFPAIRKAFDRVRRRGRKFGPQATPAELHRLRIACKKLRYLLTFFRSLLPAEALKPFLKELKRLQQHLGDFNDLHVQGTALKTFAGELMDTNRGPPATLLAMGRLLGQMEVAQAREREAFQQHILRFYRPGNQRNLERLLKGARGGASRKATSKKR